MKQSESYKACTVRNKLHNWRNITASKNILSMLAGTRLEFSEDIDLNHRARDSSISMSKSDSELIDLEIDKMLQQHVIQKSVHQRNEFISTIFLKEKPDGGIRVILNLKKFNDNLKYRKHKMSSFKEALNLVTQDCYFASCDLKSAYYSIPIHEGDRKYLKFIWKDQLYEFTCYSNGLCSAPRYFTKITKPIFAFLHSLAIIIIGYLDDSLIVASNKQDCWRAIALTISAFMKLGFFIHPDKSILVPCQEIVYLGFIINSINMTVRLTDKRKQKLKLWAIHIFKNEYNKIKDVAKLIGLMVASFPAVTYGPLYYRNLEREKSQAIKENLGKWENRMKLSDKALEEINWWINNIEKAEHKLIQPVPHMIIKSDASLLGWGTHCLTKNFISQTGGAWLPSEYLTMHINELETYATYLSLKTYAKRVENKHILLYIDNTSAMLCIRKFGSCKSKRLDRLVKRIWKWCIRRNIWLSVARIASEDNVEADAESRNCLINQDIEYMLNKELLFHALKLLKAKPDIDLFASRINNQFEKYMSYKPDPYALAIDAFSESWSNLNFYAFPPFSLLTRVLKKIREDQATGVIVAPLWRAATFFPVLMQSVVDFPVAISARNNLLRLPENPKIIHPLARRLRLLVCLVSGQDSKIQDFRTRLLMSSCHHGAQAPKNLTIHISKSGEGSLLGNQWIPFLRL